MFHFKQVAGMIAIHALMVLGATTAWAGRGDVDPNYGEGGRMSVGPSVLLALPGDRLVIGEGTGEGFRVRMVDATGRNVLTFGDGGVVLIDSSAAARTFQPEAAALAPNGDMIFEGPLSDTGAREILRLHSDGQPVLSFGNRGDGFVEPTVVTGTVTGLAIDPDGKIVLLEVGSWTPDGSCGSTARLQRLLVDGQPDTGFGGDGIIEISNLDVVCNGAPVIGARADGGAIVGNGHGIVAVDAAGNIDSTFGVDGRLAVNELDWARVLTLPDGGLLIVGSSDTAAYPYDTLFLKFDRNGQPDLDFGAGTGSVTIDLGAELLVEPSAHVYVEQLALDPGGEHVVAQLRLGVSGGNGYSRLLCSGIARLSIEGAPDTGFGRNGVTCLNFGFALIGVQSDGAPLFRFPDFELTDGAVYRLLPDNRPSPGFLSVAVTSFRVGESDGTAIVAIERLAGRDGAVSVDFATVHRVVRFPCYHHPVCFTRSATAGDYTATSGRLDWASGDDSQRTVTVRIHDDDIDDDFETFGVDFSEPGGGTQLITANATVFIADDDETSSTPPPTTSRDSGGGGSVSWATLLALLTLMLIGRRRVNRY